MSTPANHLRGLLETGLDDTFAIVPLAVNPIIPRGKHGVMAYRSNVTPLAGTLGNGALRDNTFTVHVLSPMTDMAKAQGDLNDALDAVLDVLETDDAINWSGAGFEAYNDQLWCYTITLTMFSSHTPEPIEVPVILDKEI